MAYNLRKSHWKTSTNQNRLWEAGLGQWHIVCRKTQIMQEEKYLEEKNNLNLIIQCIKRPSHGGVLTISSVVS